VIELASRRVEHLADLGGAIHLRGGGQLGNVESIAAGGRAGRNGCGRHGRIGAGARDGAKKRRVHQRLSIAHQRGEIGGNGGVADCLRVDGGLLAFPLGFGARSRRGQLRHDVAHPCRGQPGDSQVGRRGFRGQRAMLSSVEVAIGPYRADASVLVKRFLPNFEHGMACAIENQTRARRTGAARAISPVRRN